MGAVSSGRAGLARRPIQIEHELAGVDLVHLDANLMEAERADDRERGVIARRHRGPEAMNGLRSRPGQEPLDAQPAFTKMT